MSVGDCVGRGRLASKFQRKTKASGAADRAAETVRVRSDDERKEQLDRHRRRRKGDLRESATTKSEST